MNFADLIGQTLDSKYKMTRELGRGGMGTVYLATHLGTERPVAVKVIAPQFMERPEFVERFRREARAAGRLRHPNVVNVTDFGFAETSDGRAAYLVMEYLDGCTLGEVLEEEKNLPVGWTLDILEQVCSAVHAAHEQGIIHRDLKPDNIWLEPNQRGGYTVKVLDFGIAKLEEPRSIEDEGEAIDISVAPNPTLHAAGRATLADNQSDTMAGDGVTPTLTLQSPTMVSRPAEGAEARTAIMPLSPLVTGNDPDTIGTRVISEDNENDRQARRTTSELTRVGAVIGTPLYMSPEQCRGERLDARSDIYSLGVIAYQMLSGKTPFEGDFTYVMEAHKAFPVPPLDANKVRKKLKRVIVSALAKNPDDRPQTAEAFSSILRSRSEGIFGLLRRATMIYTEHLPKFIGITILLFLPFIIASVLNVAVNVLFLAENPGGERSDPAEASFIILTLLTTFTAFFCGYLATGTITWMVNQILALPLKPVRMRPALHATWRSWKRLIGTGLLSTVLTFFGYALCLIPGIILSVTLVLVGPVVMMEQLRGFPALKRSKALVMRSLGTTTAAVALLFFVPLLIGALTGGIVALTVKSITDASENAVAADNREAPAADQPASAAASEPPAANGNNDDVLIQLGPGGKVDVKTKNAAQETMTRRIGRVVREGMTTLLMLPIQILLTSLSSIIIALLYLKTRQAGGESLGDLFKQFEESEHPRKKWQERVRERLIQSGRIASRP